MLPPMLEVRKLKHKEFIFNLKERESTQVREWGKRILSRLHAQRGMSPREMMFIGFPALLRDSQCISLQKQIFFLRSNEVIIELSQRCSFFEDNYLATHDYVLVWMNQTIFLQNRVHM